MNKVLSLGSDTPSFQEEFVASPLARSSSAKSKSTSKGDPYRIEVTVIGSADLAARDSNGELYYPILCHILVIVCYFMSYSSHILVIF